MTQITIDGETFRVQVDGDALRPTLLLCNSLGTTLSLWDGQMPALLKQFRVIRYDSRGHGQSTQAGPYSIGRLGRDALAILDALDIETAHFAGISMGGAVGQWLLAHAPQRVERVVLACTAARFGSPEGWNARIRTVLTDGMATIAKATMERWFSPTFSAKAAPIREMLLASPPAGYARCCAALRDLDLRQDLYGIDVPVLVITGSDDPIISAADTAFLLDALTSSRHVSLPGRHLANVEAGAAFTDAVIQFLTAKLPVRRRAAPRNTPNKAATKTSGGKTAPRGTATRRASAARQPLAKAESSETKPAAPKAVAGSKKATAKTATAKKATSKTQEPTRRKTKTIAVRGAVKKPATKAKPSKAAAKKAPKVSKRPPAPRRKPAKTPRRPSGRRKT